MSNRQWAPTLAEIVAALGGVVVGQGSYRVTAIKSLAEVGEQVISFVAQEKYLPTLKNLTAGCVIIKDGWQSSLPAGVNAIVTANPNLYYAHLSNWWQKNAAVEMAATQLRHETAVIRSDAKLAADVRVGPFSYIGHNVTIGAGVDIGAHCVIEDNVTIGAATRCVAMVYIGHDCIIGQQCLLQPGAVIGRDGFGFANDGGRWVRIAQLGRVLLGDRVEVGANSCVDRGAINDTVIDDGVKIDNLIQIGHNVKVGADTAMASGVGIAGSTVIGKNCTIGGASGIGGHLTIVDGTHIAAATNISRSIHKPGEYCGLYPFEEKAAWGKNASVIRHLAQLRRQVKELERQLAEKSNH